MPSTRAQKWPTSPRSIFFSDVASRPTLAKAESASQIVRLHRGVWTADLSSPTDEIIAANVWKLVARFIPDAVIVDRSAASGGRIDGGVVTVATDERTTPLALPGVVVLVRPRVAHATDLPWTNSLTVSSPGRTIVDNLAPSRARGHTARTLSLSELQNWLADKSIAYGGRLAGLLESALNIAREWGLDDRAEEVRQLFDEAEGRKPMRRGANAFARSITDGTGWDVRRLAIFESARAQVGRYELPLLPPPATDGELPFYEAYFSNYIEGTEFSIDDARTIVETQRPPIRRPADGHDIIGTHRCVVDPLGRASTSTDVDQLEDIMRSRHRTIMVGRPEIGPGEFKDENNRVGAVTFVNPNLVSGTLRHAFAGLEKIPAGFPRAVYMMFVVAEIHPFTDGNGRIARLMMNAELSSVGACRIVVPTVLRNEYISGLRRASTSDGDTSALAEVLRHAWAWTAAMPWENRAATDGQLAATNALVDSVDADEQGLHLALP